MISFDFPEVNELRMEKKGVWFSALKKALCFKLEEKEEKVWSGFYDFYFLSILVISGRRTNIMVLISAIRFGSNYFSKY